MDEMRFAGVITGNRTDSTDRVFTYGIPEELLETIGLGHRVLVPFGMGSKKMEGYVVELSERIDFPESRLKYISELMDDRPVLTLSLIHISEPTRPY